VGYTGNWYLLFSDLQTPVGTPTYRAAFTVADPTLDIRIWDFNQAADVTGKTVPQGTKLGFRVDTNMYSAINNAALRSPITLGTNAVIGNDGYINIKVKDESGTTLNALLNKSVTNNGYANTIRKLNVSYQPWLWGTAPGTVSSSTNVFDGQEGKWATDALDVNGQFAYPVGTYTVSAESYLNAMLDNYRNAGADYTGKTVSQSYTITLASDTVKIEANKDSVVRSKPFSVTITGRPSTTYHLWIKGTSTMSGGFDDQTPLIRTNQLGVQQDVNNGYQDVAPNAGSYLYENGAGKAIVDDVSTYLGGVYSYANVTLSSSGTRTVEFTTTNWTKAQKYTLRVEQTFPLGAVYSDAGAQVKSDEVDVKVEKGAVTIVAAGDQSYYLGEEIKFSGTNTETYQTYLFIIGPNLHSVGSQIQNLDPRRTNAAAAVINNNPGTFKQIDVAGDNTWSWKWGTSNYALDAGTYTIYAVSQPVDKDHLENAAYGTVSIIIKKPFVSATASQSTVAKGDRIYITGTAEGQPSAIAIWIMGKNFAVRATESVNSDASFKYEVRQETTRALYSGQYFVVVQHPMQNDQFDIYLNTANGKVYNAMLGTVPGGVTIFTLLGAGSLQGSDAAEALAQGINDPNVDDTYTKLQFLVEEPIIRVDPIGDRHVGDKFTITAQTNLAVDDEVLVQVYSSSFKPTQKSQSGEFSGATGTIKVTKGDSGLNTLSFDVDSSTFKPDEYIVTETAVIQDATGTALFNVLEGPAPTAVPTVVTTVPTAVPTTVPPTAVPTPVPTTQSPGYGALIALIGLGAVAFIVVRRH
jgi:PGF-CTERM protein